MTDVNIKVTAPGNELVSLGNELEKVKKQVRELKAAFAGMGIDADAALGKITSGSHKTQRAKEEELRLVQRLTESLRTQEQSARAANESRHRDFGRALRGGGIDFNQWKQLSQRSDEKYSKDSGIDKLKADALREQAAIKAAGDAEVKALREKRLARKAELEEQIIGEAKTRSRLAMMGLREQAEKKAADQEARQRVEQIVKDNKQLLSSKRELADAAFKKRHDEGWALVKSGQMTWKEFDATRPGMDKLWMKESGAQSAFDKIANSERDAAAKRRQNDQREITRLTEQHATAQERFNARIARANELKKNAGLHESVYKREIAAANKELASQGGITNLLKDNLLGLATSYLGVQQAIRLVGQEVTVMRERETRHANAQIDIAQATRSAMKNIRSMDVTEVEAAATDASKQVGTTPLIAMQTINEMASAKGSATDEEAFVGKESALQVALELNPRDPAAASGVAKQLLLAKTRMPKKSFRELAGMFQAAKMIGVEGDEDFHRNVVAHLTASEQAYGNTFAESAAMRAAMGSRMGDTESGRLSTQAFVTTEAEVEGGFEMTAKQRQSWDAAKGTRAKIKLLNTPEFKDVKRRKMGVFDSNKEEIKKRKNTTSDMAERERINGEMKALETKVAMYNLDPSFWDEVDRGEAQMPKTAAESEKLLADYHKGLGRSQNIGLEEDDRRMTGATERRKLADVEGGRSGNTRDNLREALQASGQMGFQTDANMLVYDWRTKVNGMKPNEAAASALRIRQNDIRGFGGALSNDDQGRVSALDEAIKLNNEAATRSADLNQQILEEQRETNRLLRERNGNANQPAVPNNKQPVAPRPAEALSGAMRIDNGKSVPGRMF